MEREHLVALIASNLMTAFKEPLSDSPTIERYILRADNIVFAAERHAGGLPIKTRQDVTFDARRAAVKK